MPSLWCLYSSSISQVPPLQCGDANISIQMPSLRSLHCSQGVHQSSQTGSGEAEVNRHSSSDIHRRYAPNFTLQHIAQRASICNPIFLLENTGFMINNKKSLLQPTQEIEFFVMIIDSVRMDLRLPGEKIKSIRQEAQKVLSLSSPSAHSLSQLAGKLNATTPALQMAPLFCRSLQTCLKQALAANSQDYKSPVQLSPQAKEYLWWWVHHLSTWNGRSLIVQQASMTIISNTSLQGWGATCNGVRTRGPWSPQEQSLHINCLELLAATLAIQTFAKERSGITILLKLDNTTAVAYINRMGGTVSPTLSHLTRDLWLWCMGRNILLQAQHLPGALNSIADRESRTCSDRSEWKLSPALFQRINMQLGHF